MLLVTTVPWWGTGAGLGGRCWGARGWQGWSGKCWDPTSAHGAFFGVISVPALPLSPVVQQSPMLHPGLGLQWGEPPRDRALEYPEPDVWVISSWCPCAGEKRDSNLLPAKPTSQTSPQTPAATPSPATSCSDGHRGLSGGARRVLGHPQHCPGGAARSSSIPRELPQCSGKPCKNLRRAQPYTRSFDLLLTFPSPCRGFKHP